VKTAALIAPLVFAATITHAPAQAPGSFQAGDIVVETPWSRATPAGAKVAGGYMRITNTGTQPDRLIGGSATVADRFELHRSTVSDGVARMELVVGGLQIGSKETVELKPGTLHAMLVNLRQGLKPGDVVEGTLVFEKAGTIAIEYRVGGIGAQAAPAAPGDLQHH
jgi:periplasmic copper chaperone A